MSTTQDDGTATTSLSLDRESAWVVHHVALDCLLGEDAERPTWAIEVVERVEADHSSVTPLEGRRLRERLREYLADDPPARDVEPARRVLDELDAELDASPECDA